MTVGAPVALVIEGDHHAAAHRADPDPLATLLRDHGLHVRTSPPPAGRLRSAVGLARRARQADVVVVEELPLGRQGREWARALRWSARPVIAAPRRSGGGSVPVPPDPLRVCLSRRVPHPDAGEAETAPQWDAALGAVGVAAGSPPADGIGVLGLADLDGIVAVHLAAFPDSSLTRLGPAVVARYYRWQFIGPHPAPFAVGFRREGTLVGFLFGGVRRDAVSGFSRRFLPTIAFAALRHPVAAVGSFGPDLTRVARLTFLRRRVGQVETPPPGTAPAPTAEPGPPQSFGVLSIAVQPEARGTGAAPELMAVAERSARSQGHAQMHLSVSRGNGRALRFYERLGWIPGAPTTGDAVKLVRPL